MKFFHTLFAVAMILFSTVSCQKEQASSILIKNPDTGYYVSGIAVEGAYSLTGDYIVETSGSWSVSVSGSIPATVTPSSGTGNTAITIYIPENTGSARTGELVFTGGGSSKNLTLSQGGK